MVVGIHRGGVYENFVIPGGGTMVIRLRLYASDGPSYALRGSVADSVPSRTITDTQ